MAPSYPFWAFGRCLGDRFMLLCKERQILSLFCSLRQAPRTSHIPTLQMVSHPAWAAQSNDLHRD